jgi:hypothetical protein
MVLDALPLRLEFPIDIGNNPSIRPFSLSRLPIRSRSLAVSLLHRHVLPLVFGSLCVEPGMARFAPAAEVSISFAPTPQVLAPGVVSGPANDGSPAFSPDGNTIFFTRSAANWSAIVESHKIHGQWSHPTLAPFSGE